MSVRVMSWVFEHFKADERGKHMSGQMVVMLAVADSAEDDGTRAFPGVERLARKTRLSHRQVIRLLRRLCDEEWLVVDERTRRHHHDEYSIPGMGDKMSPSRGSDQVTSAPDQVTSTTRIGDIAQRDVPATRPLPVRDPSVSRIEIERLCVLLADLIAANGSKRPTIGERWRTSCRLLLDRDGRSAREIEAVIRWSQGDEFWRANVLSMTKLRAKFDTLRLQMNRKRAVPKDRAAEIMEGARLLAKDQHPSTRGKELDP